MSRYVVPVNYRIDINSVNSLNRFLDNFSDCRVVIELKDTQATFDFEVGVAKKPVLFLGFVVDLEDGSLYYGKMYALDAIRIGYVNDLMKCFMGYPVSRDIALLGVEKFKLTGSLKKMFESMESYSEGSMISTTVNSKLRESVQEKVKRAEKFYDSEIDTFLENMRRIIRNLSWSLKDDEKIRFDKEFRAVRRSRNDFTKVSSIEENMFRASSPAAYESHVVNGNLTKQSILASNVLDICNAMEGAEDVVLTSDLKGRLKNLGIDSILNGRELGSITANPAYLNELRHLNEINSDLTDIYISQGYPMSIDDSYVYIIRNSIKMLGKIVAKIKLVKEGK